MQSRIGNSGLGGRRDQAELITNEARRAERTPTPDSMDLYFQGIAWYNKGRNTADVDRARGFFDRALALDPDNFDAALAKASADLQLAVGYRVDDKAERLESVEANLNRVLSQSPNNTWAHYLIGRLFVQTNRLSQAIAESERALTLNPNLAAAHAQIGLAKLFDGHPEQTEGHELEALRASPRDMDANVWVAYIALSKLHPGAYEDALGVYRHSVELNPNYPTARFYLAATLAELGRLDEAKTELRAALALNPGFTLRRYRAGAQSDNPVFLEGPRADHRRHAQGRGAGRMSETRKLAGMLVAFDVLVARGGDVRALPLARRKAVLKRLARGPSAGSPSRFSNGQTNQAVLGNQNAYTDPVRVSGVGVTRDYNINISGTWSGTLTFQRSFDAFDVGFTDAQFQVPGPPVSIAGPNIISPFSGFVTSLTGGTLGALDLDNVICWERVGLHRRAGGHAHQRVDLSDFGCNRPASAASPAFRGSTGLTVK